MATQAAQNRSSKKPQIFRSFFGGLGDGGPEGSASFDEVVRPLFEGSQPEYVALLKATAIELGRQFDSINIDMVRKLCPVPEGLDPRILGCTFARVAEPGLEWERVDVLNSVRRMCHNRPISQWRLLENGIPAFSPKAKPSKKKNRH